MFTFMFLHISGNENAFKFTGHVLFVLFIAQNPNDDEEKISFQTIEPHLL